LVSFSFLFSPPFGGLARLCFFCCKIHTLKKNIKKKFEGNPQCARSELDLMKKLTRDLMEMTIRPPPNCTEIAPELLSKPTNVDVKTNNPERIKPVEHFSQTSPPNSMELPTKNRRITSPTLNSPTSQQQQQLQGSPRDGSAAEKYMVIPIKVDVNIKFRPKSKTNNSHTSKMSERDQIDNESKKGEEEETEDVDDVKNDDAFVVENNDT
jgi:hypothetical protein